MVFGYVVDDFWLQDEESAIDPTLIRLILLTKVGYLVAFDMQVAKSSWGSNRCYRRQFSMRFMEFEKRFN